MRLGGDTKKEIDHFWHLRTIDEALQEVKTSPETGLSASEIQTRQEQYGTNTFISGKRFRWYKVLFEKLNSLLIYILLAAGVISFLSHEVVESIVIVAIILMTVLLGFFQEYKADRTVQALKKLTAKKVTVLRDGKKTDIVADDLVVGDVVFLKRGDIVPADLRLIDVAGLQINESVITGESNVRTKSTKYISDENVGLGDMTNMAFSSTHVANGSGRGVVVETGQNTIIGKISFSIEHIRTTKSPIQKKIDRMSTRLSIIVLSVSFILFLILMAQGNEFYSSLLLISALIIAGIPESFPLALTLTFSHGIKEMARKNAVVKDLNSVETLGTTTVICTDKTGTLTENTMRVSEVVLPSEYSYQLKGTGYEPLNTFFHDGEKIDQHTIKMSPFLFNACVLCNDAELEQHTHGWKMSGEPTEGALLVFAKSLDVDEELLREDNKRVFVQPFDPAKKYMISVHKHISKNSEYQFYLKGAGEIVLEKCSFYRDASGKVKPLTSTHMHKLKNAIEASNTKGLRVLSLASKLVTARSGSQDAFVKKHLEDKYIFEGFVGIEDPIREEVFDAVAQCQKAGIKIVMITGDHRLIAENIGKRLGILTESSPLIVEGYELDRMTDEHLDEKISQVSIFARTSPEHKLRIVEAFQRNEEIVAMTGDGVNDAPALKKADIGIAMGKNGTEVAREAANMVLADDNFATIVTAVKEGRTVYSNIRRFIYYLLTGNFTEVGLMVLSVIIGLSMPLTALMILFVNLVTSTIPALALSVEPTHEKVMRQKPRNPHERLLSEYILTKIIVLIPFILFGTLGLFMWELHIAEVGLEKAMTVAFVTLIVFELFHAFNARRLHTTIFDKGFFKNPYLFLATLGSFILTLLAVYSTTGQTIFGTVPLVLHDWIVIIGVSSLIIVFAEVVKLSIRSEIREQENLRDLKIPLE